MAVKENDPQNLIKKAIDDHEKVTDDQLDDSLKQAFHTGIFTLSEIVFDKEHRRAVVAYSCVCGMALRAWQHVSSQEDRPRLEGDQDVQRPDFLKLSGRDCCKTAITLKTLHEIA